MKINFNASAAIANNALTRNDNKLAASLGKLSSGYKITHAKDNPSGLAMAKRMNAQIAGVSVATDNAGDGISVIEIADGTMSEIHDMLQRLNELSVKASTGTLTEQDREIINNEAQQLKEEIDRISGEAEFNGQKILDGSFDLKGYTDNVDVKVAYYGDEVKAGQYQVADLKIGTDKDGDLDSAKSSVTITGLGGQTVAGAKISGVDGNIATITGDNGFELKLEIRSGIKKDDVTAVNFKMELAGFGAMDTQIGANEGQQLGIRIPRISCLNMGIESLDLTTAEGATKAIDQVDAAIKYVSEARSRIGAYQNRLEHTVSSLDITSENMTAAYSRIMDTDMAEEMTEYTTLQVLSQASTSMLAQANERPSQVLQLLQ